MLLFEVMRDQQVIDAFFVFEPALREYRELKKHAVNSEDATSFHIEVRELEN